MQNRYTADVGDFGKYGLLRHLISGGAHRRLGVVWYLAPPEDNNRDGSDTGYLERSYRFQPCDPQLFDEMQRIVNVAKGREVTAIRKSGILGADTIFHEQLVCLVPDPGDGKTEIRRKYRDAWLAAAIAKVADCDIVFLDPDNGIGGRGDRKWDHKNATWEEIRSFAADGSRTVVIYQHQVRNRGKLPQQAEYLVQHLEGATVLGYHRGRSRLFLVVPAKGREDIVRERIDSFLEGWSAHFSLLA